jgi:hypothetical protein
MANLIYTIPVPDNQLEEYIGAFSTCHGYQPTLPDGNANPESAIEFSRKKLNSFVQESIASYVAVQAAEAAKVAALAAVTADIGEITTTLEVAP